MKSFTIISFIVIFFSRNIKTKYFIEIFQRELIKIIKFIIYINNADFIIIIIFISNKIDNNNNDIFKMKTMLNIAYNYNNFNKETYSNNVFNLKIVEINESI